MSYLCSIHTDLNSKFYYYLRIYSFNKSLTSIFPKIGTKKKNVNNFARKSLSSNSMSSQIDRKMEIRVRTKKLHMRYCKCRYNVARARTLEYITPTSSARMHPPVQVASLCKWELNGMLVGMQDSSLQGAQCIIELRTLRCNGWAWRFRDPFSLSLSLSLSSPFLFIFARLSARARGMTTTARAKRRCLFFTEAFD